MRLILIGLPQSGKTTFGKLLAGRLGISFIDTDALIESAYKQETQSILSIREIYKKEGEAFFRCYEEKILHAMNTPDAVIATGGGTVLSFNNRLFLKKLGFIIFLKNDLKTIFSRMIASGIPAYLDAQDPEASFQLLYQKRISIYEELADYCLNMENPCMSCLLDEMVQLWQAIPSASVFALPHGGNPMEKP